MNYKNMISHEKCCEALNRPATLPDVSTWPTHLQEYALAHYRIITLFEAMNFVTGNWKPNYFNKTQSKYSFWGEVKATEETPSGVGFSRSDCGHWNSVSIVGARLLCPTWEMIIWAYENHTELFIQNQLIMEPSKN